MYKVIALLVMSLICISAQITAEDKKTLTIFAAASLTDTLQLHAANWSKKTDKPIPRLSFAASAIMARQIKAGAPADIFISANPAWVAFLSEADLTEGTPVTIARNQLVFAAPKAANVTITLPLNGETLVKLSQNNRLALADPKLAPAGMYAKHYLENISVWDTLSSRVAYGSNVRQTLLLIERGGLYGFVYKSDAKQSSHVKILFTIPENQSGTILYQAAKIKNAPTDAEAFLDYLLAPESQLTWQHAGFSSNVSN